jgi:hypothetical protein
MKLDYTAAGDNVSIFINPALGLQPVSPSFVFTNVGDMSFDGLSFASFIGPTNSVDEIRLGTTYADVTPTASAAPAPSSLAMLAGFGGVVVAGCALRRNGRGDRIQHTENGPARLRTQN